MRQSNRIENLYGPVGSYAGIVVLIAGLILVFSSLSGIILILIGGFVGLSDSSTTIYFDQKQMRFSNNIFGILKTGRWIKVTDTMKVGIIKKNTTWRANSQSNRSIDVTKGVVLIVLFGSKGEQLIPLKKFKSIEAAETEIEYMCETLGLQRK